MHQSSSGGHVGGSSGERGLLSMQSLPDCWRLQGRHTVYVPIWAVLLVCLFVDCTRLTWLSVEMVCMDRIVRIQAL